MRTHHPSNHSPSLALTITLEVLATLAVATASMAPAATAAAAPRPSGGQIVRITTHAFDWGTAAVGAAAGIGISMLAVGGALLITGTRSGRSAPAEATARRPARPTLGPARPRPIDQEERR